jgi:Asp-tRNA(Asn)/Glu-tRNA(Gln) amidotransferase A subunit family amidase
MDCDRPPTLSDYRNAGKEALRALYDILFERIEAREPSLRVFDCGRRPHRARIDEELERIETLFPENDRTRRPPLFGVPVGVKGIYRTNGYALHCGSLLPPDLFSGAEATLVKRLRDNGAVVLGLTATTEFAFAEPAPTANPHHPGHTPGGSSSGSAAGVAAGFFPLALGTQTIGSILRPASYCGIVGFKPSFGLLPTDGIVFFSRRLDHAGFFCLSVAEARTILAALAPAFSPLRSARRMPFRLAVPEGAYLRQAGPEILECLEKRLGALASRSDFEVIRVPCFDTVEELNRRHLALASAEFALEHARWFDAFEALYRPRTIACIREGRKAGKKAIEEGAYSQKVLRETLTALIAKHEIDAWVCPSAVGEADEGLASTGDPVMNLPWTHAGLPALSLPMGFGKRGLPLGMQLVGAFDGDLALLETAEAVEKAIEAK